MSRAIDPFEEYLRKKKVEMLEKRYRQEREGAKSDEDEPEERAEAAEGAQHEGDAPPVIHRDRDYDEAQGFDEDAITETFDPPSRPAAPPPPPAAASDSGDPRPPPEDAEADQRLQEEMREFLESGASTGAELFEQVETGISADEVEEIRDALDEVFEEEEARPQTEDEDEPFVDFFRQVQQDFDEDDPRRKKASPAAPEEPAEDEAVPSLEPEAPIAADPTVEAGLELEEDAEPLVETTHASDDRYLSLLEILSAPVEDDGLRQRVDLLCRVVAKLVERSNLSENEIVEVLIKSGVEF